MREYFADRQSQQETEHEMRYSVVVISRQVKFVAQPVERCGFCISEMSAPRLNEKVEEDHVVGETRKLEVAVANYHRDELRDWKEVFERPISPVVRVYRQQQEANEINTTEDNQFALGCSRLPSKSIGG